jgi:ribose/xylose/arabinose/galactoside ABC-type transport system permease subunit
MIGPDGYNLNSVAAAIIRRTALAEGTGSAGALLLGLIVCLLRFLGVRYGAQLSVQDPHPGVRGAG